MKDQLFLWRIQDTALQFRALSLGKIAAKIGFSIKRINLVKTISA
jgi:hypothetical protein